MDSRKVSPGALFVATRGVLTDGHHYLPNAIEAGAAAVLVEELPSSLQQGITYLKVEDSSQALGIIADNFYGNPSSKLSLVGITGTNGKTTTATLLYQFFTELGYEVGLISTIRYLVGKRVIEATHTTPNALKLNQLLAEMVQAGCEYCFMEVSSHAVVQKRISGIRFKGALFTNISHDHLDYHGTFKEYIRAKKTFFDQLPSSAFSLINDDDRNGSVMLQNTSSSKYRYALQRMADFKARIIEPSFTGTHIEIDGSEMHSLLVGKFNVYNLLAVYGTARLLGVEKLDALTILSKLRAAAGRFDCVRNPKTNVVAIVDYAHTPDALENVLSTINGLRTRNEQLITLVGCGGDRDRSKRPKMASIATKMSDKVILTSDNPRTEDPELIIKEMKEGVPPEGYSKAVAITNRREAIQTACMMANPGDIILIAGKGHESYQEIHGVRYPFDDKEIVQAALGLH